MADNSPRGARLDHVSDAGDLVFVAGGEKFLVTVDDKLERAILEAKQIRLEASGQQMPQTHDTLPISKIQQLIRAGSTPSEVAEQYHLNEALVRRFSSSVQTEKQYAIEQFKRVPAPKESRAHIIEDLVDMAITSSQIERDSLAWSATRHGHEPWHIFADFTLAGRQMRAEWTWNMHDNSVVSLNDTAKRILEEQNLGAYSPDAIFEDTTSPAGGDKPAEERKPGESETEADVATMPLITERADGTQREAVDTVARTARTAEDMANESQEAAEGESETHDGDETHESPDNGTTADNATADSATANGTGDAAGTQDGAPDAHDDANGSARNGTDARPAEEGHGDIEELHRALEEGDGGNAAPATRSITSEQSIAIQDSTDTDETPRVTRQTKPRRRGRSAVPSWDEILFGD